MSLQEDVSRELNGNSIEDLENLAEWWLSHEYNPNMWEDVDTYNKRKDMVIPMIIEAKLNKYEEDY